jgi:uncharacterized membrane protein HdeD (DUF308 family)
MACTEQVKSEFRHLKSDWWWFLLLGILLTVCGTAAIVFPALTVLTTFAAMAILGVALIVSGLATIVAALWAGKWSGMLVQLLVGILYVMVGFLVTDSLMAAAVAATTLVAAFFIVVGVFRSVAALTVRYPHWGWSLLNGAITFLLGVIIYRHAPSDSTWVIGLLVGIEMLFNGWTWIALSMAIKSIPDEAT